MRRRPLWSLVACLLTGLATTAFAHAAPPPDTARQPVVLPDAEQRVLTATGSGRTYQIFIAAPKQAPGPQGAPVVYILDGNAMFLTAVDAVRAYERRRDGRAAGGAIVVGIGYPPDADASTERTLDLTPFVDARNRNPTGGAAAFLDFIERDLKPAIARDYAVDPRRQALMGHSLAGLFVVDTALRQPQAFQAYVAMSTSFWFGDHAIVPRIDAFAAGRAADAPQLRMLLTVGEYEETPRPGLRDADPAHARQGLEALGHRAQVTHAQQTARKLADAPGTLVDFRLIAGEDHGTVIPASISKGLDFFLVGPFEVPPVPSGQAYLALGAEGRYQLRMQVRALPDLERIPWLNALKASLSKGLSAAQRKKLHDERQDMDARYGSRPHGVNAD